MTFTTKQIRNSVLAGIGLAIVLTYIIQSTKSELSASKIDATSQKSEIAQSETKPSYQFDVEATPVGPSTVSVIGKTNLPDGAVLEVSVNRVFHYRGESSKRSGLDVRGYELVEVANGEFVVVLTMDDNGFADSVSPGLESVVLEPNVAVHIDFDPSTSQPYELSQKFGVRGRELLASPDAQVIGEKSDNPRVVLEKVVEIPMSFPYMDQLE